MSKMDEIVYAVPRYLLFSNERLSFNGLLRKTESNDFYAIMRNIDRHHTSIARCNCENDPTFKHLIPYVVLINDDKKVLTVQRTTNQTEKRLHGKYSIGIGGHIGPAVNEECNFSCGRFIEDIDSGMRRELRDELMTNSTYSDKTVSMFEMIKPKLRGLINVDEDSVGKVHLGLLYFAFIKHGDEHDPAIVIQETENMVGKWMDLHSISKMKPDQFESWSSVILAGEIKGWA